MFESNDAATQRFLNHVRQNYDLLKEVLASGINPYELRNNAASLGYEMTPQEVKDAIVVLQHAVDILREENEY